MPDTNPDPVPDTMTDPIPPVARKEPRAQTIHGDTRVDEYHWLREKSSSEVIAYLEAENAYTESVMAPTVPLQHWLYDEMLGRIQETDVTVPYRMGEYLYYSRTEAGRQYPTHCRKAAHDGAPEEITLDLNAMAEGHSYLGLGAYTVSDDGTLLAYSTDVTGFRQYTLYIKDLRTGEVLSDRAERVGSVAWAADSRTLFYTVEDDAKRQHRLYRHTLGAQNDPLLYEETDELFHISASRSRSRHFVFVTSSSSDTTEVRCIECSRPDTDPRLLIPREKEHRYYLEHRGDTFFIRTDRDAKNFRIVTAPITNPGPDGWKEMVPHNPAIMREDLDLFSGFAVVSEREAGLEHLRILDLETGGDYRVEFPESAYAVSPDANRVFETDLLRYRYQSFVTPASVFDTNMRTRERTLLKQTPVPGGYDPSLYATERIEAPAADGTPVPVSLVYRKDRRTTEPSPLLLYGYGSYGISIPVSFSSNRVSLLDRGVIFAVAHIRGGGELGEEWRDAGKLSRKMNTFTDFIAAAEHLIRQRFTAPDCLAIQGGSAGGLLMGAVTNLRPELFRAVIAQVPFMDVLNTMLDSNLPLTVGEYLEWGNPNIDTEYAWMKAYCPYTNIQPKRYPAMLVRASLNDSQVMYWEAAKYVARLRATKIGNSVLLLKTTMGAGHGGPSGRYDSLREAAFDYAFLLTQLDRAGSETEEIDHA